MPRGAPGADLRRQLIERLGFARSRRCRTSTLALDGDRPRRPLRAAKSARVDLRAPDRIALRPPASRERRAADSRSLRRHRPLQPADRAARRRRPGRAVRDLRFAAQIAEVEVDVELGTVKLLHVHAAHDVGRAINPTQVEGQIHGGIAQGIGMALMEEYVNGRTDNLHDYLIPTVGDVPPITVHLIEDPEPLGPWGAKGVGEPALVATAPAILNAIHAGDRRAHARGAGDAEPPARGDPRSEGPFSRRPRLAPSAPTRHERSASRPSDRPRIRRPGARRSSSSIRARPRRWPPTRCAAKPARCSARSAPASSARAIATATSTAC